MEHTLGGDEQTADGEMFLVLILVLMEHTLGVPSLTRVSSHDFLS